MPCMRCGTEFGIFKKESYCRNCGFSFCSGCLSKKIIVPKTESSAKHSVCNNCYSLLSSGKAECNKAQQQQHSPPAALLKRMEALNSRQNSNGPINGCSNQNMTNTDRLLAQRLQQLRPTEPAAQSVPQLEERLAKLRGTPAETAASNQVIQKVDKRSEVEKAQDLFNQVSSEIQLENQILKPEEEIRLRLARLKGEDGSLNDLNKPSMNKTLASVMPDRTPHESDQDVLEVWKYMMEAEKEACLEAETALYLQEKDVELKKKLEEIKANRDTSIRKSGISLNNGDDVSDDDNEDKITNKVVQQFLAEANLDLHCFGQNERKMLNYANENVEEELPWCTICNDNATLRCYGCDGDLYCRRCFRECHDALELRDHPSVQYLTKQKLNGSSV